VALVGGGERREDGGMDARGVVAGKQVHVVIMPTGRRPPAPRVET
jgi:hypothetical protein